MRKFISFFAILLLVMMNGQDFKYGVTGNFHQGSIAKVHDVSKGNFGGALGGFVEISLVENDISDYGWLFIVPQLEYSMQGEHSQAQEAKYGVQRYNYDYLAMQLYLKYYLNKGRSNLFLFAGPRVEFLVREDRNVNPAYDLVYYKFNLDDKVNEIGYGVSLGAGLRVSQQMEAFLRFDRGLSKVYPNNDRNNTYNRLLAVGINYYLNENWW